MLTSSLLLAETTTPAAAGPMDGFVQLLHGLGVNLPGIIAQMVNFSIVAFVLWRFAFKPVLATLDERQKRIAAGLGYAEEMQAKLAATQQESAQLLKAAQLDAQKLIDEARKAAKEFADRQNTEATARAADTLAKAQQAIELEHKKMLNEARGEIARLVVKTTEQVLARKLSEADRSAYNDAATKELAVL